MKLYITKFLLIIIININVSKIYGMEKEEIIDLTSMMPSSSQDAINFMDCDTNSTVSYDISSEEEEEFQETSFLELEESQKQEPPLSFSDLLTENLKHIGSFLDLNNYINFKFTNKEFYLTLLGEYCDFTVHSLTGQNIQQECILINKTIQKIIRFSPDVYSLSIQPEIGKDAFLPLTRLRKLNSLSCTLNAIHDNHQFFKALRQCKQLSSLQLNFGPMVSLKSLWEKSIVPALQALNLTSLYLKFPSTLDYEVNTSTFIPNQLSRLENLHLQNLAPGSLTIALKWGVLPPGYIVLSNLIRLAPNLKALSIPANEIGTFNKEGLACLFESVPKSLTSLNLSNNALTTEFLQDFAYLLNYFPNLKELGLANNKVEVEVLQEFQKYCPKIKILYESLRKDPQNQSCS